MISGDIENGLQDVVQDAAQKITDDLRWRGLVPGERYISADEAGKLLGVSVATADRAMRILTDQEILIRQRGRGTFVGPKLALEHATDVRAIQIMMPRLNERLGLGIEDMIRGVHNVFPDMPVAIHPFPVEDPMPTFNRALRSANSNGGVMGMGAILAPQAVQELLAERQVPAVLLGTPFPGVDGLISMDLDHHQTGSLTAQHLLARDHCRFGVLLRDAVPPGDGAMLQGFTEVLGAAGITCDALQIRHSAMTEGSIKRSVKSMLAHDRSPTAIVGHPYTAVGEWVKQAAAEMGFEEGRDFDFVRELGATYMASEGCPVQCCVSPEDVGKEFGHLLARVARGETIDPAHTLLPVELRG